ncbi:MAG TPA: polysaccharide deacetylase family protein [Bacteroidales bacterium]|jgi:peptidoglycan/xylan/chitin deacetylase (PgdA/CDA1 family)|nr:polysaccharide deacetylase family protein [Bacteroidales bacterium]
MKLIRTPGFIKWIYPGIMWDIRDVKPSVYLSFDDGPTPVVTDSVLTELNRFNSHATFFCIGRNVERHPDIYERIVRAGHSTGNHTYSHLKGWYTPDKQYYDDIQLAAQLINSSLYRPAYGMITPAQLKFLSASYRIVLWDIMSYDFDYNTSPEQCLNNVIRHARPGSIIVFHDSLKAADKISYALPRVLEFFKNKSWACKSII